MFCGRACHYDKLQLRCDSSGSGASYDGQGNAIGIGHYSTMYSMFDTQTGPATGFVMYCGSTITDQWQHGIQVDRTWYGGADGPWGSIATSGTDAFQDMTVELTFVNYSVYATADGVWRTRYDSVEVRVNGNLVGTGGGLDFYNNTFISPNSIPVYSGCLYCEHTTQADWTGATGRIEGGILHVSAEGAGTFGVRWLIDGSWLTTPIAMPPGSQYATGGDSYGFGLQNHGHHEENRTVIGASSACPNYTIYHGIRTSESGGASNGWLFPNPPREAVRMNQDDYEAMVLRYGSLGWYYYVIDRADRTVLQEQYVNVHPARSEYLARVTNGTHAFEDQLHEPCYCWVNEYYTKSGPNQSVDYAYNGVTVIPTDQPTVPPCGQTESQTYNYYVPSFSHQYNFPALDRIDGAPIAGNLGAWTPDGAYWNTIGSPHYSYFLFFPTDDAWKIDNAAVGNDELWFPARQQLIDHSALPELQRTRHMVDVVAEPIIQNGLTGLIQQVSNMPCYWGIGKLDSQKADLIDSVQADDKSKPRWSLDDGTAPALSGSAFVIPKGQNRLSFALGSYTVPPFEVPHLAKEVEFAINDASVDTFSVYLVADDGTPQHQENGETVAAIPPTKILIGKGNGRYPMPAGSSKKWLTSAAYDGGNDWGTDTYVGIASAKSDASNDVVGHPERNVTLGSTAATHTGAKIVYEIVRAKDKDGNEITDPIKVGFPTFYSHQESDFRHVKEAARHSAMILPNGPVNRFGGGGYFDYGADSLVPYEIPEGELIGAPMAGDWLAHKRPWFLGKADGDGLLDEIKTIYEEGVEYTTYKHLWRDPFDGSLVTHSFMAKNASGNPIACMVNSYSAIPPTGAMPSRRRSAGSDWKPTGAAGCYTYTSVSNRKNVVSPQPLKLYLKGDTNYNDLLTPLDLPAGWYGGYFTPKVQNDALYVVRDKGDVPKDWFRVRGWRGFLSIIGLSKASKGSISSDVSGHNRHAVSYPKDGVINILIASNSDPTTYDVRPTDVEADSVCVRWLKNKEASLAIAYAKDSQIRFATSRDEGKTFTMPTDIASGDNPTFLVSRNTLRYFYWLVKNGDSADIHGQVRTNQDDVAVEEFTVLEGVDSSPITVREAFQASGTHLLIIDYVEGGEIKTIASKSGVKDWK